MGSSAQNSSGVHWCRRRVMFNEVPEKVPEVRGFAQSQVRLNRLPEKVPEWEALVQSRVRFNRVLEKVPEKVPDKVPGGLGAKPSQVQQGPEKVPRRFRRRFQRRPGRLWCGARSSSTGFRRRFWWSSGRLWCNRVRRARSGSTGFPRRFWRRVQEALVQSQVRFNGFRRRLLGILGAGPGQVQQVQQGFQRLALQHASERFVNIKRCGCWGYRRSLFFKVRLICKISL